MTPREKAARALHAMYNDVGDAFTWEEYLPDADAALTAALTVDEDDVEEGARNICQMHGEDPDYFTGRIIFPDDPPSTSNDQIEPQSGGRRIYECQWMRRADEARTVLEAFVARKLEKVEG